MAGAVVRDAGEIVRIVQAEREKQRCVGGVDGHVVDVLVVGVCVGVVRVVGVRHRVTICRVMVRIPNSTLSKINL